ncbi:hypothetical protein M409DRAFT_61692 [Zasmidium cellare ATCC 36951]|uniref:HNH nuclease domain-containing protein n=1 Tax=Zasmidium cellare ATCC 36951 TaxID=1080233 RepID=A0A6A6BUH9_ZASCE|nr:uncharacterized protein M409DRAFT_61692 [Zasmidium cellare ATCC 36951]KAF2158401.1 hypothetical protein M409DRAFT_61692 [Zasmidium cellare ATCC 36951]
MRAPAAGAAERVAANSMRRYINQGYGHGADRLSNSDNKLLLRSDLHSLWDNRAFLLAPKEMMSLFCMCWRIRWNCLRARYHNVRTYPLSVSRELLFARFAWALLPHVRNFVAARQSRTVSIGLKTGELVTRRLSANQCSALAEDRKKSLSPKKRKAQESGSDNVTQGIAPSAGTIDYSPAADSAYAAHE